MHDLTCIKAATLTLHSRVLNEGRLIIQKDSWKGDLVVKFYIVTVFLILLN